jgi:flavin-dependent dehydrogenase
MTAAGQVDVVIIGGGPAGSAAAMELALAGRRVTLLERTLHAHDKVCGDFLSAEAVSMLDALGLDPRQLGAQPIHRVRLAGALGTSSAMLPFAAHSVSRRALDEALLNRAAAAGARVLRGYTAESVERSSDLWHVRVTHPGSPSCLSATHVLLATGKHDLRGLPRPAGRQSNLMGLKMYLRLAPAQRDELEDSIELMLLPGGYGGVSLVERQVANLCFVLPRELLRNTPRDWPSLLAVLSRNQHLRTRLAGAEPLLARPLAVNPIPYGFLRQDAIAENLFAVGDQAAVIPSFTGDGLAIALHSGRLAARSLLAGRSAQSFQVELHTQLAPQVRLATVLSRVLVSQPQRTGVELATRLFPRLLRSVATRTRLAHGYDLARRHENACAAA